MKHSSICQMMYSLKHKIIPKLHQISKYQEHKETNLRMSNCLTFEIYQMGHGHNCMIAHHFFLKEGFSTDLLGNSQKMPKSIMAGFGLNDNFHR